ncbi:maleylpyruvate isomerase family mycothiol-dependent enzyme [Actinomadura macrotermitis]|nr:maleylpyruvate isomerase family mycothiol-dependent enzyme [Actinomadura macrotermitis]
MDDRRTVLTHIEAGTERLLATLGGLDDARLREPSALPDWTRGHVAAHIARNADSLWNLLEWARTGREIPQYPSLEQRNADIEEGAARSVPELVEDVRASAARFAELARALPEDAWEAPVQAMLGWPHPAWYTLFRRWHEVEAHHVDLVAGYGPADWPDPYVRWALADTLHGRTTLQEYRIVAADTGETAGEGPVITGSARALLGWLSGRTDGAELDADGPLPAPPPWPAEPGGF